MIFTIQQFDRNEWEKDEKKARFFARLGCGFVGGLIAIAFIVLLSLEYGFSMTGFYVAIPAIVFVLLMSVIFGDRFWHPLLTIIDRIRAIF